MSKRSDSKQSVTGLRTLGACLVLAIVTACGGGGSGGGSRDSGNPGDSNGGGRRPTGPGTISGVAHDGPISGATINIYEWNGQRGRLLASTTTDSAGTYSLLLSVPRQPLLLESVGGAYVEEATGSNVIIPSGQALFAVQNYDPGQAVTGNLTYYSTLAAGLAENLVKNGSPPGDAVATANQRIADLLGIDLSKAPAVVNNPMGLAAEAGASAELGFATAAVSSLAQSVSIANDTRPAAPINSIGFIQAAFDDIRTDGKLDGRGALGPISLGKIRVTTDMYRRQLALNILKSATNATINRLQVDPTQFIVVASRLNNSTDPIFANVPVVPFDIDRPNIVALSIGDGDILFGSGSRIAFSVQSLSALTGVQLLLNDTVAIDMADPSAMITSLNTTRFPDGQFDFTLVATDAAGASVRRTFKVILNNLTAVMVSNTLKADQFYNGMFDAQFSISDPAGISMVQYLVDDKVVQTETTVQPFRFDTRQFGDGPHTVTAQVTNVRGETNRTSIGIKIDNTPPDVTFSLVENTLTNQNGFNLTISATDAGSPPTLPNVANAGEFLLDGKPNQIPPGNISVTSGSVSFTQAFNLFDPSEGSDSVVIPDGAHTFSFSVSDVLNSTVISRRFTLDRTGPMNQITSPRSCVSGGLDSERVCDPTSSGFVTFRGFVRDSVSPIAAAQVQLIQVIQDVPTAFPPLFEGGVERRVDLTVLSDGSFSAAVDTRGLPNGRYRVAIISRDAAGNTTNGAATVPTSAPSQPGFTVDNSIFIAN